MSAMRTISAAQRDSDMKTKNSKNKQRKRKQSRRKRGFPFLTVIFLVGILGLVFCGGRFLLGEYFGNDEDEIASADGQQEGIYYYYELLSPEEQALYDKILEGIKECEADIEIGAASPEDVKQIVQMIYAEHPEIFWSGEWRSVSINGQMTISFEYQYTASEIKDRQAEIENSVTSFLEKAQGMESEYEKIKSVYEYILDTVEYVAGCADNQNLYSSLVNHESICAGYTRGTQYLLQRLGIQAIYVGGMADGNGGWGNHAWNIVRCGKNYYQVDSTFGDGFSDALNYDELKKSNIRNYAYLCRDDKAFAADHKWTDYELPLPKCTTDDLNYYKLNGMYSSTYDESVDENMKESVIAGERVWIWQFGDSDSERETKLEEKYMDYLQEYSESNSMWHSYSEAVNLFVCGY